MHIETTWLHHEGGTKFYQAFRVTDSSCPSGLNAMTVIHYGPYSGGRRGKRPVEGGAVEAYDGGAKFSAQISMKLKRGYSIDAAHSSNRHFDTLEAFNAELIRLFGASRAQNLLLKLGHTLSAAGVPDPTVPSMRPIAEVEDTHIDDISELPDNCGIW